MRISRNNVGAMLAMFAGVWSLGLVAWPSVAPQGTSFNPWFFIALGVGSGFLAADLGMQVTLIDQEPNPGGVCLYRGCIPSKALLHVAKVLEDARQATN